MKRSMLAVAGLIGSVAIGGAALAQDKMMKMMVEGDDQSVAAGTVITSEVMAAENGWLVVHRTDGMKPGPVVGHAPLKKGANKDVVAILTEEVKKGDKLMLMLHSEQGGSKMGIFEYTLGAKEDGPVRVDGKLVMTVITAE
jgi:hypothetical protein